MGVMLVLGIIVTLIIVSLFVWLMIIIFQEGPKPQDFTIVDNFMPQYTNGFSQGILLEIQSGEKRDGYVFVPKDIDYYGRKKRKNMAKIEQQIIYVEKKKAITFPRGTFSSERNRIWLLPPTAEGLQEEFKTTKLGQTIMKMIEESNNEKTEVEVIREGSDRIKEIYSRMGDGEISAGELDRLDEMHKNLIKHSARTEEKKTTFGSPVGSN